MSDAKQILMRLLADARELKQMKVEINGDYSAQDLGVWDQYLSEAEVLINQIGDGAAVPRFALLHDMKNPGGYAAEVTRCGDPGVYEEVRIGLFKEGGEECLGDVLVGLSENGEPRILVTTGGDGDADHDLAIFPLRQFDKAVEDCGAPSIPDSPHYVAG